MPDLVFTSKGSAEVLRQQQSINQKAAEMGKIYREDTRAASDLERAMLKVFQNPEKALKAFNDGMGVLKKNFADGKLTVQEYDRQVGRLNRAYEDVKASSGDFKKANEAAFGAAALTKVGGFIGALGGITAAIGLVKSEYEAIIALQDKANSVQLNVGQARNVMIRNMLGSSPQQITGVLKETTDLAGQLQLPEAVVAAAMAEAMSANSGDAPSALKAVRLAGRFLPDQPGEIGEFAGALLDLQKASGSASPEVNFGLLASISQRSRVASPRAIAMNAPAALIGSAGLAGATGAEAAALYSALTSASGDKTGATSGSAQIAFSKSLGLVFDAELRKPSNGQAAIADQLAGMTMGGKIAMLQQNPELARQFLATSGVSLGEGSAVAPLRSLLLDRNSVMARAYADNLQSMPNEAGLSKLAGEAIGNFGLNRLEPLASAERALQSLEEQTLAGMPNTLSAEARGRIKTIMLANGNSNVGAQASMFLGQLSDSQVGVSIDDAVNTLQNERDQLRRGRFDEWGFIASEGQTGGFTPATVEDKKAAAQLDQVIAVLKEQDELQKETNRKLERSGVPVTNN